MATIKQDMEDECQQLQETLRHLMDDRSFIQDEFLQLTELQQRMIAQLREDNLSGEGHLHTFQAEKNRIEDRLEQLEQQLKEKNEQLLDLDAKASEYLRRVTTQSNNLYDDDDDEERSEQNESQQNLILKLVKDEMTEHSDDEKSPRGGSGGGSLTEDVSIKNVPSLNNDDSVGNEGDVSSESASEALSDSKRDGSRSITPPTRDQIMSLSNLVTELKRVKDEMGRCITNKDESLLDLEERLRETRRELASLKGSVSDVSFGLRHKEDGSYYSLDRDGGFDNSRKLDLERHVSELQEATGQSSLPHEEKLELLHKIEILESMIEEDNSDLEVDDVMNFNMLGVRGRSVDSRDFLSGGLRVRTPSVRSSSVMGNSISERVAMLEKDLADAHEKLSQAHCHMHVLAKEKEHKQKECDHLQSKVNNVEGKMNELQGTFDALVKTMMGEREQLVKDIESKMVLMEQLQLKLQEQKQSVDLSLYIPKSELAEQIALVEQKYCEELRSCKDTLQVLELKHTEEVQSLKHNKEEMEKYFKNNLAKAEEHAKDIEVENQKEIELLKNSFKAKENEYILRLVRVQKEKDEYEEKINQSENQELSGLQGRYDELEEQFASLQKEEESRSIALDELREQLAAKETQNSEFQEKIKSLEVEISDFAPRLKEEMNRRNEEYNKLSEDKDAVERTFFSLQEELKASQQRIEELSSKSGTNSDKAAIEALKEQLEDLNAKNLNLTSEMYTKEEESSEELNAREATIQELRITLTNNQKQSRENYQMLQDDIAALNLRFAKEKEEFQAILNHLKEKLLKAEEDGQQKQQEVDALKSDLENLQQSSKELQQEIPAIDDEDLESEEVETADKATSFEPESDRIPVSSPVTEEGPRKGTKKEVSKSKLESNPSASEAEYRELLSAKEAQIADLSQKVEYLEKQLLNDASHSEGETSDGDLKSRFQAQMAQIAELNSFVSDLQAKVQELTGESSKLKETVDQLQTEKVQFEEEKKSLMDNCEERLNSAMASQESLEVELGTKKNLVEGLNFKLRSIESSVLDNPCDVEISLIDRLDMLGTFYDKKIKENNDKYLTKINIMDKQILSLKEEISELQLKEAENTLVSKKIINLEEKNKNLTETYQKEKTDIINSHNDKMKENEVKYTEQIHLMEERINSLQNEIDEYQLKGLEQTELSQVLSDLKKENSSLREENKNLINALEMEKANSFIMLNKEIKENEEKYLEKLNFMEQEIVESLKKQVEEFKQKELSVTEFSKKLSDLETENYLLKTENKNLIDCQELKKTDSFNMRDEKSKENEEKYLRKIDAMEKEMLMLKKQIDEFQLQNSEITELSKKLSDFETENNLLKTEIKNLIESQEQNKSDSRDMKEKKNKESEEKYLRKIDAMEKEMQILQKQIDEFQLQNSELNEVSKKISDIEVENKLLKIENQRLIDGNEQNKSDLVDIKEKNIKENEEKYLRKIDALEKEIQALKKQIDELQVKDLNSAEVSKKLSDLEAENNLLKEKNKNAFKNSEKERTDALNLHEKKMKENSEKYLIKINMMDKQILSLKEEIDEFQLKALENAVVSRKLADLEAENHLLKEEKKNLVRNHDQLQNDALNMQNQMVTDLEKLILSLESEKKELEVELKGCQDQLSTIRKEYGDKINVLRESISMLEKERDVLRMEIARLVENQPSNNEDSQGINSNECLSLIEDLTKKVTKLRTKLEEAQASLEEKGTSLKERLARERAAHRNEMQRLRKDMRDEMDILEQQKEDLRVELTAEIERVASEWASRFQACERDRETHLMEEKAQFGRVLVGKNDDYEKLVEEKSIEVSGYQSRLANLQAQLEERSNLIDELETNIEELVAVRENLEEKLASYKAASAGVGKSHPTSHGGPPQQPSNVKAPKLPPSDPPPDSSLPNFPSPSSHS